MADDPDYQLAIFLQNNENSQLSMYNRDTTLSDERLAHELQKQFELEENVQKPKGNLVYDQKSANKLNTSKCLTDPSWEVIDPTPDVHVLFMAFNDRFFWGKLATVCVQWSKRMTTCAGVCSYGGYGTVCQISLSEPLLKLRPRKDLVETLLHEMIHAFLFVTHNNRDRDGHGPEFHKHMYRINQESGTSITVYHDFHDEVNLYQQHWWRCNGPCQNKKPYYGTVRRAINRAPGPYDRWFAEHARTCGGTFIKVKEPEKPSKILKEPEKKEKRPSGTQDIRKFITSIDNNIQKTRNTNDKVITIKDLNNSSGSPLTSSSISNSGAFGINKPSSNSNQSKSNPDQKVITFVDLVEEEKSGTDYSIVREHWISKFGNNNARVTKGVDASDAKKKIIKLENGNMTACPVCHKMIPLEDINVHLDDCLSTINLEKRECVICRAQVDKSEFESHVARCAVVTFDNVITVEDSLDDSIKLVDSDNTSSSVETKPENVAVHETIVLDSSSDESLGAEKVSVFGEIKNSKDEIGFSKNITNFGTNNNLSTLPCFTCGEQMRIEEFKDHAVHCNNLKEQLSNDQKGYKKCEICKSEVDSTLYVSHSEKCLLSMYDQMDEKYTVKETVPCLACGVEIQKSNLNAHLEECMAEVFSTENDFKDIDCNEGVNADSINCPICFKVISGVDVNVHIDLCLKR